MGRLGRGTKEGEGERQEGRESKYQVASGFQEQRDQIEKSSRMEQMKKQGVL